MELLQDECLTVQALACAHPGHVQAQQVAEAAAFLGRAVTGLRGRWRVPKTALGSVQRVSRDVAEQMHLITDRLPEPQG